MNKKRIEKAIVMLQDIVKHKRKFNMLIWQEGECNTLEELHTCGMGACFGGYLALQPEWKKGGGEVHEGTPVYNGEYGYEAVALYLGVSYACAKALCAADMNDDNISEWYGKHSDNIKPQDVIKYLKQLLKDGWISKTQIIKAK